MIKKAKLELEEMSGSRPRADRSTVKGPGSVESEFSWKIEMVSSAITVGEDRPTQLIFRLKSEMTKMPSTVGLKMELLHVVICTVEQDVDDALSEIARGINERDGVRAPADNSAVGDILRDALDEVGPLIHWEYVSQISGVLSYLGVQFDGNQLAASFPDQMKKLAKNVRVQ